MTPSEGSSSKAWIVGPVVGAALLIASLIGFLLWRRRKRSTKTNPLKLITISDSIDYNQLGHTSYRSDSSLEEPQDVGNHTSYKSTSFHELYDTQRDLPELPPGPQASVKEP